MQGNSNRRTWTIIGIIAFCTVMLLVWLFNNVIGHDTTTYNFKVSPKDATVLLDGQPLKVQDGKFTVKNGTHTLTGTRKYFTKATKQISTDNDLPSTTIFLILGADSPEAKKYLDENPDEQNIREGASDTEATKINDKLHKDYPYITQLPYETTDFTVDYHTNGSNHTNITVSIDVTLNPTSTPETPDYYKQELADYKAEAISYMKSIGINTDKTDIKYDPDPARL